ncbi:uncharacterized protein LOC118592376 [Onychomys torridus]|uniref:uncharacterized protein LOC118592376 n=1 Tax=Onychomys torridus TaxID=38674 RepID=UPI00167FBF96|nr:uncharacterized protein LOC118592376 [Onychomys torridus]
MRQEVEEGQEQGGSRNFLQASSGMGSPLPLRAFPSVAAEDGDPPNPWRALWLLPGRASRCTLPGRGRGAHLVSIVQGARAGLPAGPAGLCRLQAALSRGGGPARQPLALRPMALGPSAPALSAPGTFSPRRSRWRRRRRQAGGCARADTRAADTHVEGGPGGARGSTRAPARLPRSRGHAATAAPTGGTQSRPRPGQARRAAPRRCRSTLTLAPARAPPATLAPKHPALLRRAPRLCRQPDKAPARRPFHHLPETGLLSHVSGHPPQHAHICSHTHTFPHPGQGRAQTRTVAGTLAFTDTH